MAFYSTRSQIALRIISRQESPIGKEFWRDRIIAADAMRRRLYPEEDVYRAVFSDSDLCSSIVVDRYGEFLTLQTLSQGSERLKPLWIELLAEYYQPRAIVLRNDVKVRELEGLEQEKGVVWGALPENPLITMSGLRWNIDLIGGQKTGMFLDQRENYLAARAHAQGSVLDAFSYAGGFGLHAAANASEVECADISIASMVWIRRNASLNGIGTISPIQANCFDLLRSYHDSGRSFDMVILDPPAFAKSRAAIQQAKKGYKEINLRAMKIIRPGGWLITCSCSYHISTSQFEHLLRESAADAHRDVQVVETRGQSRDHPVLLNLPETRYLKCLVLRIL
jgi:23S rRNA (cytosine1962-C5)-methyltransferase